MTGLWFGRPWPDEWRRAPVCEDDAGRMPTPVGEPCLHCTEPIVEGDRGQLMPYVTLDEAGHQVAVRAAVHRECQLRAVLGGPAHVIFRSCTCCGGTDDPDLGLDYRTGAIAVWEWVERHGAAGFPSRSVHP